MQVHFPLKQLSSLFRVGARQGIDDFDGHRLVTGDVNALNKYIQKPGSTDGGGRGSRELDMQALELPMQVHLLVSSSTMSLQRQQSLSQIDAWRSRA